MSFIRANKLPHTKVQYLPRFREAKSHNLLLHNGTVQNQALANERGTLCVDAIFDRIILIRLIVDTPYESPVGLMNTILKNTAGHSEVAFDTESWHRPGHFAPKFAWFACGEPFEPACCLKPRFTGQPIIEVSPPARPPLDSQVDRSRRDASRKYRVDIVSGKSSWCTT
jgi:hypothetical protein